MTEAGSLRVLLVAPHISREATGEGFVAFKWAEALSRRVVLTVAALQSPRHTALAEQLPLAEVVTWPEPRMFQTTTRFRSMVKPETPVFNYHVRHFLRANSARFDIAHQIMPQAMRYATPLIRLGVPYVIGPLGGALDTPASFAHEATSASWFTRLRRLDRLRLRHDPWLRSSYSEADLVLGVAPYIQTILHDAGIALKRYENVLELGIDGLAPDREPAEDAATGRDPKRPLRLLHVGRGVRTKGLRDTVRALGHLHDLPGVELVSAGTGEDIEACRAEAERLGVANRVRFLGLLPRDKVEDLYADADIFVFPSFREPAGNVIYEAMRWGLPVIAAARGGPDAIVDETCGLKIPVTEPDRYARDISVAIRRLAEDPALRHRLGRGGRSKLTREGLWPGKAERLVESYRRILEAQ